MKHYSKREQLAYLQDWMFWKTGLFRGFEKIDFSTVTRIVFVCKGNICRSAYAEAKLRQMGFQAASFGVEAKDGRLADPDATRIAALRGVDLTGHRTTSPLQFKAHTGDIAACMEWSHAKFLIRHQVYDIERVFLLGTAVSRPRIADPYGKPDEYFSEAFDLLDSALLSVSRLMEDTDQMATKGDR